MGRLKRKLISAAVCVLFVLALMAAAGLDRAEQKKGNVNAGAVSRQTQEQKYCVVIDAGHGGFDPGKVGVGGVLEKDINLKIALILKGYLEADDIEVVLTRDGDYGLYEEKESNKKVQDMKNRVALITETSPDLTVSIHQNSYPEEYVHGAQVFYYEDSPEGQKLAQVIQEQIAASADPENTRQIKPNTSYYLLKKTPVPIVIVECGFLSNNSETQKLCSEEYQQRVAWAVHMGIMRYLNRVR